MFGKVAHISIEYFMLNASHSRHVGTLCIFCHRLGHPANKIILPQLIDKNAVQRIDDVPIKTPKHVNKLLLATSHKELHERHGIETQRIHFSHGKRLALQVKNT